MGLKNHDGKSLPKRKGTALRIGAILVMASSSACSTQGVASTSVELLCTVEDAEKTAKTNSPENVCDEIKREIDTALSRQTKAVKSVTPASLVDWIKVDVRFAQGRTVTATVAQRIGRREIIHPEIAVDVMDKPLGMKEIKLLAAEVARAVVKAAKA